MTEMTSDKMSNYLYYKFNYSPIQSDFKEKTTLTKEAEHPLQDAPKLTELRDISGGSCSPSVGILAG